MAQVKEIKSVEVKKTEPVDPKSTKDLEIKVITIKMEDKEFDTYKALQKNGKYVDCKFVKDVKNLPKNDCIITVRLEDMNLDKMSKFPKLWIKAIQEIKPIPVKDNTQEVADLF